MELQKGQSSGGAAVEQANAVAGKTVYRVPASHAQRRFWTASQLNSGDATFNVAVRWRLEGEIDAALMERACNLLLERHEVLHTALVMEGNDVVQEISPELQCELRVVDLRARENAQALGEELAVREARMPFELSRAPLIRFSLLRLEPKVHILLCTAHHAVCDGLSVGVLAHDLGEIYDALSRGREPELCPLDLQFADYAIWEQETPREESMQAQECYWRKTLEGFVPFEVETDFPRPAVKTSRGNIVSRVLPRGVTDRLAEFSREQQCTLFVTSLAGLSMVLRQLRDASEIVIGTQVLGRERPELERVVGVFTNTLPLRIRTQPKTTMREQIARVREVVEGALANQEIPFDRIVKAVQAPHDAARNPLFQVHFIFQRTFIENKRYEKFALVDMPSKTPGAGFDLNFFMVEREDGWRLSCEYNTDLFRQNTVEWMLGEIEAVFAALPEMQEHAIGAWRFAKERRQLAAVVEMPRAYAPQRHRGAEELSGERVAADAEPLEEEIQAIFREVLSVREVEAEESFFDLGGHSILAARLLARIEKKWPVRLSLTQLVQCPTPRTLARAVRERADGLSDKVVPLQKGNVDPIYVISQSLVFRNIAKALGSDRGVYALRMPESEAKKLAKPYTMEAIAAYYVELLREVQPEGPYRLAGWCVAATIAYEVAQQLMTQGERVELLIMLDAWAPGHFRDMNPLRKAITMTAYGAHRAILRFRTVLGESEREEHRRTNRREQPTAVEEIEYAAADAYKPCAYRGRVALFCSVDQPVGWLFDHEMGWRRYLSPVPPIHRIPGSHLTMFDAPGARLIADGIVRASSDDASTALEMKWESVLEPTGS